MNKLKTIAISTVVLLAGCATTNKQGLQCPVGTPPLKNVNQQVQFNDNGVMYQGQAFAETSQEAESRAKTAAQRARQDAEEKSSAYGYFFDCSSQGISVTVQKSSATVGSP